MKVKICDKIYDSENQPVMVILTAQDKINIANMHPHCTKYACFQNSNMTPEQMQEWMMDS